MRSALVLGVSSFAVASFATLGSRVATAQTVDQVVASHSGGCTTAGVEGLSEQLVDSHLCAYPGAVSEFTPHPNITLTSSRVHPLGTSETVTAIRRAADSTPLSVNSAFRTLVEQYLLYEEGGCGLAATPGNSNHQTGRAVDLGNYSAARSAMTSAGCSQSYPSSDPVHFDCPGPDMRQASVLVFQRLWNLNHPEDRIDEDGLYGPQTRSRLGRSPAAGFGQDLCASMPVARWGAEYVMQTFPVASAEPIHVVPGEEVLGTIELRNIGTETWDGNTRLGTTEPRDVASPLAASDWLTPGRADAVVGTVEPGDSYPFTFSLRGPSTLGRHCQFFGVLQEGVTWFSDPGQLGPPDDLLEVCVLVEEGAVGPVDAGTAPIGSDAGPPSVEEDGGGAPGTERPGVGDGGCSCRATGSRGAPSPWPALVLVAAVVARRRRLLSGR